MLFDKQVLTQKAGLSWTQLSKPSGFEYSDAIYNACEDSQGRIYASGMRGVFYTDNDGTSWVTANSSRSDGLVCLYNDSIVSVNTGNGGIKISTDRGATWSGISGAGSGNWPLACPFNDNSIISGAYNKACIMLTVQKNGSGSNISYSFYAYNLYQDNSLVLESVGNFGNLGNHNEPLKMIQCKKVLTSITMDTPNGTETRPTNAVGNSVIVQFTNQLVLIYQYQDSPPLLETATVNLLDDYTLIGNLSNQYLSMTAHIHDVCVTSTGRIIALFSRQDTTYGITLERYYIAYNDTLDSDNWVIPGNSDTILGDITYRDTNDVHARLCAIENRIMLVCGNSNGWRYSDDDGLTWNTYDPTQDITTLSNIKITGLPSNKIFYAASWQMYLSTPTYATVKELGQHNKYLDRTGLQEIHTQLMSYIQEVQQS